MNMFDMRGPEFLAVYLLASVVGLIVLWVVSRRALSQSAASFRRCAPTAA